MLVPDTAVRASEPISLDSQEDPRKQVPCYSYFMEKKESRTQRAEELFWVT